MATPDTPPTIFAVDEAYALFSGMTGQGVVTEMRKALADMLERARAAGMPIVIGDPKTEPLREIDMSAHTLALVPVPASHDNQEPLFHRWSCSCGSSSKTLHGSKAQATRAHADHAQANSA